MRDNIRREGIIVYPLTTHIHFVGIGGIGMSSIAQIFSKRGYTVSGCDSNLSQKSISLLQNLGCTITHNNDTQCHSKSIDVFVRSTAVPLDVPELSNAKKNNITILHRSELLAQLMKEKISVGITGTHGKTTTSALLSHVLLTAKKDPTIIIGGHLLTINNNAHHGSGELLVAEADESDRSLLNLPISYGVLTNIDLEHLETYKNISDLKKTFLQFIEKIPQDGKAFIFYDDENCISLFSSITVPYSTYGTHENSDWRITDIVCNQEDSTFSLIHNKRNYGPYKLSMPGKQNVFNASVVIALSHELKIKESYIIEGLKTFSGVDRRFTYKGTFNGAEIFDDYGHHPKELDYTFAMARKRTTGKVRVIFQPHRYTRTKHLWNDFIKTLNSLNIDELILTDIYEASEQPLPGITSQALIKAIQKEAAPHLKLCYLPLEDDFTSLSDHLKSELKPGDLLLLQGAGKANLLTEKLLSQK